VAPADGGWIRLDGVGAYGFEAGVPRGHLQTDFLEHWSDKLRANMAEVWPLLAIARLEPPADLAARIAKTPGPSRNGGSARNLRLLAKYPRILRPASAEAWV
jgi:hypothetical protein